MNFPVWDPGFSHGLLIAIVAILHVFVSHFAVGGGLFLVISEWRARRNGDAAMMSYLERHARFFILITLVFGAISGVGIWFTIGLINPAGTSSLIRAFVWGWAIEWVFFAVEIAAALIYYYGWHRLDGRTHLAVGWIYAVSAWLSMVVINGILAFQLTPGAWLETQGFWDGFFNPTYWPSLVARTFFAVALAGIYAFLTGSLTPDPGFRSRLIRYAGVWAVVGLAVTGLGVAWWWRAVPDVIRASTTGVMPVATAIVSWMPITAIALAAVVLIGTLVPRVVRFPVALAIALLALVVMGTGEWVREAVRKPFVIYDYRYSNGLRPGEMDAVTAAGLRSAARWVSSDVRHGTASIERTGEELTRVACFNCHARDGYMGFAGRVKDWDLPFTAALVQRVGVIRGPMPPWPGSEDEAMAVATYLQTLKPVPAESVPLTGAAVFENRCGSCHTIDGYRSMRELTVDFDMAAEEYDEYLLDMESDEMPAFTGSDEERAALAGWLAELGSGEPAPGENGATGEGGTP